MKAKKQNGEYRKCKDFRKTLLINDKKICKLINGRFSWIMNVDGEEILFQGLCTAEYFAKHYKKLGYKIKWEK